MSYEDGSWTIWGYFLSCVTFIFESLQYRYIQLNWPTHELHMTYRDGIRELPMTAPWWNVFKCLCAKPAHWKWAFRKLLSNYDFINLEETLHLPIKVCHFVDLILLLLQSVFYVIMRSFTDLPNFHYNNNLNNYTLVYNQRLQNILNLSMLNKVHKSLGMYRWSNSFRVTSWQSTTV